MVFRPRTRGRLLRDRGRHAWRSRGAADLCGRGGALHGGGLALEQGRGPEHQRRAHRAQFRLDANDPSRVGGRLPARWGSIQVSGASHPRSADGWILRGDRGDRTVLRLAGSPRQHPDQGAPRRTTGQATNLASRSEGAGRKRHLHRPAAALIGTGTSYTYAVGRVTFPTLGQPTMVGKSAHKLAARITGRGRSNQRCTWAGRPSL